MRVGAGFDAHPLREGRRCVLGGVTFDYPKGPEGHSDGDVVLHAVADALLGAIAFGDLGSVFGTSDPALSGVSSARLVEKVMEEVDQRGYRVENLDLTVIGPEPKIAPQRVAMRHVLAELLEVDVDRVSVKGSTGNGVLIWAPGAEAVAASAVVLLSRREE